MRYHLLLLDQTAVRDEGGQARLPLGKPLALLIYLRVRGDEVDRDDLAETFWSSDPRRARASLRNALWTIRDCLGEDVIEVDSDRVRANPDLVTLDLDDLRHAIRAGDTSEAIDLWGRGLLPDLAISDAPGWDRWVEELEDQVSEPLRITVEEGARAAEPAEARRLWGFLSTQFPWKPEYWTTWVQTCLDAADLECAEEALAAARRHPLNDDVETELDQLAERVEAARRAVAVSDEHRRLELPMVGRSKVLARLRKQLRREMGPPLLAITGPAGVGKTRLASEFLRGETGATLVRAGSFESDARTPWALVVSLARELCAQEGAAGISIQSANALARIAPSLAPHLGASPEAEARDDRVQSVTVADAFFDLVEAVAEQQRLILFIDDLHWTDTASRDVLLRIGRMTRTDLRIVVTCRSGDADRTAIAALQMQVEREYAAREELRPLKRSEVREAIGLALTLDPPRLLDPLLDRLFDISGGNPLVINSLIQEMKTSGRLDWDETQGWTLSLDSVEDLQVPDSLRALLKDRIATLGSIAHSLLSRLAHAEGPRHVHRLLPDVEDVVRESATDELTRLELAERRDDGRLYFPHEVTREIVRRELPTRFGAGGGWVRSGGWRRLGTAASIVLIAGAAAVAAVALSGRSTVDGPFPPGHSLVTIETDGTAVRYEFDASRDSLVEVERVDGQGLSRIQRVADGGLVLTGSVAPDPTRGPDGAWMEWGDTVPVVSVANEPDDNLHWMLPARRFAITMTADESDGWRMVSYMDDLERGTRRLLAVPPGPGSAVVKMNATADRLVVWSAASDVGAITDMGGDTIRTFETPGRGGYLEWCGANVLLSGGLPPGQPIRYELLDGNTGQVTALDLGVVSRIACAGDGRWLAWTVPDLGGARLVLLDRDGGLRVETTLPTDVRVMDFVPDRLPSVPVALGAPDSISLQLGESDALAPRLTDQFGVPLRGERISIESRNPSIARVVGRRVTGNRTGTTSLMIRVDGNPWDSVIARVRGVDLDEGARWSDPLTSEYTARWEALGEPAPIQLDTALRLTGDGNFSDGIVSHETFRLPRGGTAELEFRLPLTDRRDRQRIHLCLDDGAPASAEAQAGIGWASNERFCVKWPAGELPTFDPGAIDLAASLLRLGAIPIPDDLVPLGDWTHLAIQLSPDGFPSVAINRQHVFTSEYPLVSDPDRDWHVLVLGSAVDTDLAIRNLAVWDGVRYPGRDE